MLPYIQITIADCVAYLDLSCWFIDTLGSNISIFKLRSFHSAFYRSPKKIICTKYTKCYYFHSAYVMKTVSSSHFQFPLKPCGRLKINLKIGKSIWLKLNCGYCNHHKFLLSKITLREAYKLLNILPSNISSLNTVMDSIRICHWCWLNCLLVPSFPLNGNYDSYSFFGGYMMS